MTTTMTRKGMTKMMSEVLSPCLRWASECFLMVHLPILQRQSASLPHSGAAMFASGVQAAVHRFWAEVFAIEVDTTLVFQSEQTVMLRRSWLCSSDVPCHLALQLCLASASTSGGQALHPFAQDW
jgi:hypothetical protein